MESQGKISAKELKRMKTTRSKHGNASAVILASDWHYSAVVDPAEVDFCNKFNVEIAEKRIEKLWQKSIELIEFSNHLCHIDEIVLWLGGDMLNGSLFRKELAEENELGPMSELLAVQDLCATGIEFLRKQSRLPIRVVTSHGNHARTEKERRAAGAYDHNLEYILYRNLEKAFAKTPGVLLHVGKGIQNWLDIRGYSICFQHGDAVKFNGGVGGLAVPLKRAIGRWNNRRKADCWILGHYHSFTVDWDFTVNGSLVGYDAFALSIAASYQPPVQGFMLIGPPYGKILTLPIWVADKEPIYA